MLYSPLRTNKTQLYILGDFMRISILIFLSFIAYLAPLYSAAANSDKDPQTLLVQGILEDSETLVKQALSSKANPAGAIPASFSVISDTMLEVSHSCNLADTGVTMPFHLACLLGKSNIVHLCMTNHIELANLTAANTKFTSLMFAAQGLSAHPENNLEVIRLLLRYGADIGKKDRSQNNVFDFAQDQLYIARIEEMVLWAKMSSQPKQSLSCVIT